MTALPPDLASTPHFSNWRATLSTLPLRLKAAFVGDTSTVALTQLIQAVLRIASSAILTRLLTADAFGTVGVIASVAVTFGLLSDIGIMAFIVRYQKEASRELIDEMWTLRLIRSIALSVLVALFAVPLARALGKPELAMAVAVGGLTFLLDGLDSMAFVIALRARRVKWLSFLDIVIQVLGLAVSIVLALLLGNYWAILFSNLALQLIRVWVSYAWFPGSQRRWRFSRVRAAELWKFSRFITGSTILTLIITQTDKLVFAKLMPLDALGFYVIAGGLAAAPSNLANAYVSRVLFPAFAQIYREAPEMLAAQFYRRRMVTSLGYAFGVGMLISCAPLIVDILYKGAYLAVGTYLQILFISSFFAMNNYAINELMVVRGETSFTLYSNVVRLAFLAIVGWFGFHHSGVIGLVWAVGLVEAAAQIYGWIVLIRRRIFDPSKEVVMLALGISGLGIGFLVNWAGLAVWHSLTQWIG